MIRGVRLSEDAEKDLLDIKAYFDEQGPEVSERVRLKFADTFARLGALPGFGHRRDDLVGTRHLVYRVYSYLVIYRVEKDYLMIARIIHAARDVRAIMEDDESGLGSD